MSDDIGREDTVLGTALGRAIDSQPVRATPFTGSRLAVRMAGGGRSPLMPVLAAAAAIVLGLALGAALLGQRGPTEPGPVASSPTASPGGTASPGASPTASPQGDDRIWVYLARDLLPPVGVYVGGTFDDSSAERRISSRLTALLQAPGEVSGAFNSARLIGRDGVVEMAVRVEGDLATVEFGPGYFDRIRGSAVTGAVIDQLVYTITEEPGIRRALLAERGKRELVIDQGIIDKPLTREDRVLALYQGVKTEERVALEDDPRAATLTARLDDALSPGVLRLAIEMRADQAPAEGFWSPRLTAQLQRQDAVTKGTVGQAKWILSIELPGTRASFDGFQMVGDGIGMRTFDVTPIRWLRLRELGPEVGRGMAYDLGLDDARPWRVSLEPGAPGTMRLHVDIGGHALAVSDSIAVYEPRPGTDSSVVGRTFAIRGAARAFEAHVAWRLKDSSQREVATGFATASLGTSPVWGTFTTEVKVPDNVSGVVTLEVFWPSPRDGSPVGLVAIPLRVR